MMLEDITSPCDLLKFLEGWDGEACYYLDIENCDGLMPVVFQHLSRPLLKNWVSPYMYSMGIRSCSSGFSSQDVRKMLEGCLAQHAANKFVDDLHDDFVVRSLVMLSVSNGPDLADEDKAWLEDNIKSAIWNGRSGGYGFGTRRSIAS
ncbi:hypothetical protein C8Q72DRAFT_844327 [Fomitopsis betulina]|nr:hypothetical protein C8Q72DRAFT_844327 [Fomitopsis betulina]